MSKQRSRKRHGRPGVAAPPASKPAKPDRAARSTATVAPASAAPAPATEVRPDRRPSSWTMPTWLMLAATGWAVFILWQALFRWDDTAIGEAGGERPLILVIVIVASGVSSFVAFLLLRNGSQQLVRIPLYIAAATGMQGFLVTGCALASLFMVWRARVAARRLAARSQASRPPTPRTVRG